MGSIKFLNNEELEEIAVATEPKAEPEEKESEAAPKTEELQKTITCKAQPEEQPKEDKKEMAKNKAEAPKKPKHTEVKPKQKGAANSARVLRILAEFPIAVTVITAFLLWGFLGKAFHVSWTLVLLIPLFHSLIEAVSHKNASRFAFPVLVIFVYCLLGCAANAWHPYWVLFLTIPIYYTVVNVISKKK